MTTINQASIPPSAFASVEALAMYANSILYDLYNGTNYQEVAGEELSPLVTAQVGRAGDGTERLIHRISFQLHPEWRTSGNLIWVDTLDFQNADTPARYLV